jgi:hypothetical protein
MSVNSGVPHPTDQVEVALSASINSTITMFLSPVFKLLTTRRESNQQRGSIHPVTKVKGFLDPFTHDHKTAWTYNTRVLL